ncbi:MAG: outer membrane protein assembly factor BamD [Bacteroidales bacterium]
MKVRLLLLVIIVLVSVSCGQYEKLLKSTDYELKKTKLKEYYDDGQYARASELLSQVLPRYRATEEAEELMWLNAQSYYGMRDFELAGQEFKNLSDLYPYGKYAEDSYFMAAMCAYYVSPRAELDQANTRAAMEGFVIFATKYPSSPKAPDANRYIDELREKLVEKSYLSAKLYYDMKQYKASVTALANSLKEYPQTKYREEMMYLKLKSLFLYAELSIAAKQTERYQATLDDYYSFMEEFPKSNYSKDVQKIYQTTAKMLKMEITTN